MLQEQFFVFDAHSEVIGDVGEAYVYGLVKESGLFERAPKAKLGEFRVEGTDRELDLIVKHKVSGQEIGFSVRNSRETLYPSFDHARELEKFEIYFGIPCILIGSFISKTTLSKLRLKNQYAISLERQLLPKTLSNGVKTEPTIRKLYPVIGPHQTMLLTHSYETGNTRFPRSGKARTAALVTHHLDQLKEAVKETLEDWPYRKDYQAMAKSLYEMIPKSRTKKIR
jgi:hypothetical protein